MFPRFFPMENTKQTLELRDVLAGGVKLFDFEYPSYYKGKEKEAFEEKVIQHFYFRQIGAETVGRFKHYFRNTLREIMPYYIQRYKSVELMDDPEIRPLENYNMIEEFTRQRSDQITDKSTGKTSETGSSTGSENRSENGKTSGTGETTGNSSGTGSKTNTINDNTANVKHDTPQGSLSLSLDNAGNNLIDHASEVEQHIQSGANQENSNASENSRSSSTTSGTSESTGNTQSTGSTKSDGTSEQQTERSENGDEEHRLTRRGNIGVTTYADLLEGYRKTFLNIDMEIIEELEICFLGVY